LPLAEFGFLTGKQCVDEALVLLLVERAVDIVGSGPARTGLVIARLPPGDRHIDRLVMDDRRYGIEEGEGILTCQLKDCLAQGGRCQRSRRDNDVVPLLRWQPRNLAALDRDVWQRSKASRHLGRKTIAVDGQRSAGWQLMSIPGSHDEGA